MKANPTPPAPEGGSAQAPAAVDCRAAVTARAVELQRLVRRLRERFERALARTGRTKSSIIRSRNRLREREKAETLTKAQSKELGAIRKLLEMESAWFQARQRLKMFAPLERILSRAGKRKTPNAKLSRDAGDKDL